MKPLVSHKYKAEDIETAMEDSIRREEGFVKSVFYFEGYDEFL